MIRFFNENIRLNLKNKKAIKACIQDTFARYGIAKFDVNYIFTDDESVLRINRDFLHHDYYTDIITFNNSAEPTKLESDIFISIDRVKDNALSLKTPFEDELHRVIFHGILHLCGHGDKSKKEREEMRALEDKCIAQLKKKIKALNV